MCKQQNHSIFVLVMSVIRPVSKLLLQFVLCRFLDNCTAASVYSCLHLAYMSTHWQLCNYLRICTKQTGVIVYNKKYAHNVYGLCKRIEADTLNMHNYGIFELHIVGRTQLCN